jgi:two-component system, cell cycle sensor histidine kinase and response regulator CckA
MARFRARIWGYVNAVVATALAAVVRVWLDVIFVRHNPPAARFPFPTFYLAVLWAASHGGLGPALLAIALGGVTVAILIAHPVFGVRVVSDFVGLAAYFVVTLTTALLIVSRQKAQRAFEYAEAQRRLTSERAPLGICRIALDGCILEANPRMSQITGYSRSDLRRRYLQDLFVQEEDVASHGCELFEQLRRGIPVIQHEDRIRQKSSGTVIWVNVAIWLVPNRAKEPGSALAIVQDVTQQKQAEERLMTFQKLESIGLLAGGIAHDFNNLMTTILGYASLAKDRILSGSPDSSHLDPIISAAEHGANLTRQLLAYAGKGQFVSAPLDLSQLVRKTETLLRPSLEKEVDLRFDLADELPSILADPTQIQQLIANLVINSAEAIGERESVTVVVRTGLKRFAEHTSPEPAVGEIAPGEYVMLEVQDDGDGMDHVTMARIFDPFFSTKFTGRGLGLAAVSGIVRSLSGAILVSSELGRGTTMTVLLPSPPPSPARQMAA